MKRIIIGEFKSLRAIERLIEKDQLNYSVYADIETLLHYDLHRNEAIELIFRLDKIDQFNRHHEFIREHHDRMTLLVENRRLLKQMAFLKNEGYKIVSGLSELDGEKDMRHESQMAMINPRIILVPGYYERGLRLAQAISELTSQKVLFMDTDSKCTFTLRRLKEDERDEWVYLNEIMSGSVRKVFRSENGVDIVPIVENHTWSIERISDLVRLMERNRSTYDVQLIYCNRLDLALLSELGRRDVRILWFCGCEYERLVEVQSVIRELDLKAKSLVFAVRSTGRLWNYLSIEKHLQMEVNGILRSDNFLDEGKEIRWLTCKPLSKKAMKPYKKIIQSLGIIRRKK